MRVAEARIHHKTKGTIDFSLIAEQLRKIKALPEFFSLSMARQKHSMLLEIRSTFGILGVSLDILTIIVTFFLDCAVFSLSEAGQRRTVQVFNEGVSRHLRAIPLITLGSREEKRDLPDFPPKTGVIVVPSDPVFSIHPLRSLRHNARQNGHLFPEIWWKTKTLCK